ncbi:hypothetical protein LCGC14_1024440, partial [marine sediment metagenome]
LQRFLVSGNTLLDIGNPTPLVGSMYLELCSHVAGFRSSSPRDTRTSKNNDNDQSKQHSEYVDPGYESSVRVAHLAIIVHGRPLWLVFADCQRLLRELPQDDCQHADTEAAKWQVGDRVRNISADGGLEAIAGETFDAIFTKSVLWCIPDLADFLDQLEVHLAEDGKVAFVENCLGGPCLRWLRRNIVRRKNFAYEQSYFGIRPDQFRLFHDRFAEVQIRRHLVVVYTIFGRKRPPTTGPT